jgi:hypothetical protein
MKSVHDIIRNQQVRFITIVLAAMFMLIAAFRVSAQPNDVAQFRVKNENSFHINLIQFKRVEYIGQCPGTAFFPDSQKARFVSSKTPPSPNRRVTIKNVTDGMETDPYPYTDRSYNKGEFSEDFGFKLGNSHKTKTFSVLEGENKLLYEIKENDLVIEQGSLTAQVSIQDLAISPRQKNCEDEVKCYKTSDCHDRKGRARDCRQECFSIQKCSCP